MTVIFESGLNQPPADWVELTEADVVFPNGVTFQNTGTAPFYLKATTGPKPTSVAGSIEYPGAAKETNALISDLFPGVSGGDRLWAYADNQTTVMVSHLPSTNRTVTLSPSQDFTRARIAHYNNWLNGGTVTASSTAASFFATAPTNGLTYEKWKPSSLPATWEYDHGSAANCDYCVIGAHTLGTNGNTLQVQYYDGATWVDLVPSSAITSDEPIMVLFTEQTRQRWRISISNGTAPTIGVIKFGKALQMQRPLYGGHTPVPFARQTILRSTKSETGEFLGRSKQRTYLNTSYEWQHLTSDWVRANWPSFQRAIEESPFFIAWRPATFGDVALAQTEEIPIPTNMGIRDLMSVGLSIRARGYE
jgi:hypothetical protein